MKKTLNYQVGLRWIGNTQPLTNFRYKKTYEVSFKNKPSLQGSADPLFYGNPKLYNPEEMLLAALSSCHMMSFFYLCTQHKITIISYKDITLGTLKMNANGSGQFEEAILQPTIETLEIDKTKIKELFVLAGSYCFIARSCNFNIKHQPKIITS